MIYIILFYIIYLNIYIYSAISGCFPHLFLPRLGASCTTILLGPSKA